MLEALSSELDPLAMVLDWDGRVCWKILGSLVGMGGLVWKCSCERVEVARRRSVS